MFNQRKSFLKGKLFYITLIALFVFGIWLNQSPLEKAPGDTASSDNDSESAENTMEQGSSGNSDSYDYDIMENIVGRNRTVTPGGIVEAGASTDAGITVEDAGYYLVKEVNGIIKIFYYDEEGKESLVRDTDIEFSLLGIADQALFKKGVVERTQEELEELLQDFES